MKAIVSFFLLVLFYLLIKTFSYHLTPILIVLVISFYAHDLFFYFFRAEIEGLRAQGWIRYKLNYEILLLGKVFELQ